MVLARRTYTTVSIPIELAERVNKLISEGGLGYRNLAEFVVETVRLRVMKFEKRCSGNARQIKAVV